MIHIRGCWLANGSMRSRRRAERARLEENRRRVAADLASSISDWEMVRVSAMDFLQRPGGILDKREVRLIQKQTYKQTGEIA